jgi:DnaJ-domain-containing protein 1
MLATGEHVLWDVSCTQGATAERFGWSEAADEMLTCSLCTAASITLAHAQVPGAASAAEIKVAYRQLQKQCHPDIAGAEDGHELSTLLNEVCLP